MKVLSCLATAWIALSSAQGYELHEWGTFTTVSGSDGLLLEGLQREEEVLPPFVHSHLGMENGASPSQTEFRTALDKYGNLWPFDANAGLSGKGLSNRPVSGVTVKMETPVIYFHSDKAFRAKVNVGFKGGTISQWYPARSGGESLPMPAPPADPKKHPLSASSWLIDFSKPYNGSISWDVDVLSPEESQRTLLFKAKDNLQWLRARVPGANVVRSGKETEGYLFYRGMGGFNPGLHVTVDKEETIRIRNRAGHRIPYLLIYEKRNGGFPKWKSVDAGLDENGEIEIPLRDLTQSDHHRQIMEKDPMFWLEIEATGTFGSEIYGSLKTGILRSGLLESEADAMIQTWWDSYFESEGLRIFWILPPAKTDEILPLSAQPPPEKTVRVIVGRSEILRPSEEANFLSMSRSSRQDDWKHMTTAHRFGLAIRERVSAMSGQKRIDSASSR